MSENKTNTTARNEVRLPFGASVNESIRAEDLLVGFSESGVTKKVSFKVSGGQSTITFAEDGSLLNKSSFKKKFTGDAREKLVNVGTPGQIKQAAEVLGAVEETVDSYPNLNLPEIHAAALESGELGLVWEIGDGVIGFDFDNDPTQSVWFLLLGKSDRKIKANGYINELDRDLLINWLIFLLNRLQNRGEIERVVS